MSTGVGKAEHPDDLNQPRGIPLLNQTVLGMIRAQAPLPAVLDKLCSEIERQYPGLLCSILLLDTDGTTLRHAS